MSRQSLISQWGMEIILFCKICNKKYPSHANAGHNRIKCVVCQSVMETIYGPFDEAISEFLK